MTVTKRKSLAASEPVAPKRDKTELRSLVTISCRELDRWIQTSKPKDVLQYHIGHLIVDRDVSTSKFPASVTADIDNIANFAWMAAADGFVFLESKRLDKFSFIYYVVRSGKRFEMPPRLQSVLGRPSIH